MVATIKVPTLVTENVPSEFGKICSFFIFAHIHYRQQLTEESAEQNEEFVVTFWSLLRRENS